MTDATPVHSKTEGSVGALAIASAVIASNLKFDATLHFVFFGGEEQGLYGYVVCIITKEQGLCCNPAQPAQPLDRSTQTNKQTTFLFVNNVGPSITWKKR